MVTHDDITRTSPTRMGKGLLFVAIPAIITIFLSITLWHFTLVFLQWYQYQKLLQILQATGSPHVGSATQKPGNSQFQPAHRYKGIRRLCLLT